MKITKRILKQLVKEELQTALYEGDAAGLKGAPMETFKKDKLYENYQTNA
jgi:hypothetical protein